MSESHVMPPEEPTGKSPLENPPEEFAGKSLLDRPLHQLTEDDIAQLTREDCRRYLKGKGMRRPSWNKSQAIQQVIMLKKLLEANSEAGARSRTNYNHSSNTDILKSVPRGTSMDAKTSLFGEKEKITLYHVKDLNKPDSSGCFAAAMDESAQPRITCIKNIAAGQMTIFYGGKVKVYDDMPMDKARTIMHIAASPRGFPDEHLNAGTILHPLHGFPKAVSTKTRQNLANLISPTLRTESMRDSSLVLGEENILLLEGTPVEGSSTRKASVQRYLEKRKDRFKSKRKSGMASCTSLDMYFNDQTSNKIPKIETYSPTQTRRPSTSARCTSVDNDSVKNV